MGRDALPRIPVRVPFSKSARPAAGPASQAAMPFRKPSCALKRMAAKRRGSGRGSASRYFSMVPASGREYISSEAGRKRLEASGLSMNPL